MNRVGQDKGRVRRWRVSRGSRVSWASGSDIGVRRHARKPLLMLNLRATHKRPVLTARIP